MSVGFRDIMTLTIGWLQVSSAYVRTARTMTASLGTDSVTVTVSVLDEDQSVGDALTVTKKTRT